MEFKIIIKKLNNTLTNEEAVIFNNWYNESKVHQDYFLNVKNNYQKDINSINENSAWTKINNKLIPKKKNNVWKYAVAASVALLISISYYYNNRTITETNTIVFKKNNIKIGSDKATLTLEDGSLIALEKGKNYSAKNVQSHGESLIYNKSTQKTTPEISYNYLTIPRGGQFYIELSDNTKVWLNSESQLKYPIAFIEGQTREIELIYGEAYFDVSPSTEHNGAKFKLITKGQSIEVLGTEFNVKAYEDEMSIYTTLVEGKVSIKNNGYSEILKPNHQAITSVNSKDIHISTVEVYNEISWKNGVFSFDKKPLKDIMKVLARWYDFDIKFDNKEVENTEFNGVLRKNQPIEDILTTIKNTNNINYEINDKTIIFK